MFTEISEILDNIDTSMGEYSRIEMSSMPYRPDFLPAYRIHEFRDVSIIKRSIRTSNCAFINTEVVQRIHSSKTRVLSSEVHRTCSLNAQRLISSVLESQKKDTRISMRAIYESFLRNQRLNNYSECDEIIRCIDVDSTDLEVLVSLLMASFTLRNKLANRANFYSKTFEKAAMLLSISEANIILGNLR